MGKALGSPRNQPLRARRGRDVARGDGVRGVEPALSQPRESPREATASRGPSEPPGRAGLLAFLPLPAGISPLPAAGTPGLSRVRSLRVRSPGQGFPGVFGQVFSAPKTGAEGPLPRPHPPPWPQPSRSRCASPQLPASCEPTTGGQRRTDMPPTRLRPAGSPRGR